jgi:hypothetical protein
MPEPRDNAGREPSLLRNLEGFFRGIADGLEDEGNPPREVPADAQQGAFGRGEAREVARNVQEARRGDFILRRTTIDEVIYSPEVQNPET